MLETETLLDMIARVIAKDKLKTIIIDVLYISVIIDYSIYKFTTFIHLGLI